MYSYIEAPEPFQAVCWQGDHLRLIDQRKLPTQVVYRDCHTAAEAAQAIREMVVRGAPAIGIAGAYAVVLAARCAWRRDKRHWKDRIQSDLSELLDTRPTAVNLRWAVDRMRQRIAELEAEPEATLLELALAIHREDIEDNRTMASLGAGLIEKPCVVMTHCNAGALATGGYGTALGVIRHLHRQKKLTHVYVSETRPWMQGARLTVWELSQEQIPLSLMVDSAAASLMRREPIDWLIVGADRVAANGDVINKIGTYSHALLARHHGVKVMVVAPSSSVDLSCACGGTVPIEKRDGEELFCYQAALPDTECITVINPVFDSTPAEQIDVIVTEKGVIKNPDSNKLSLFFGLE